MSEAENPFRMDPTAAAEGPEIVALPDWGAYSTSMR